MERQKNRTQPIKRNAKYYLSLVSTTLHQFLGFKKALKMSHLPCSHNQQNSSLSQSPPQNSLVGALTCLSEPFLSVSLVVLFLGDLLHLIQQLPYSKLKFGKLLLLCHIGIVYSMFSNLYVKVDSQLSTRKPFGGV